VIWSPHIDVATADDIEALAKLRVEQGWQRSELLLGAIIAWEHGHIFVVRAALAPEATDGQAPIAAVSVIAARPVGVIGNVVVRADYRRRGLAKLLMRATLDWLREQGVQSVLLDATEDGRPLYASLGFVPGELSYYAHAPIAALDASRLRQLAAGLHAHLASIDELACIADLDRLAFGGDRLGLLALILRAPHTWLYIAEDTADRPGGYVLVRRLKSPHVGIRLGPFVASSSAVAAALLNAVFAEDAAWRAELAANDTNSGAPHMYISISGASTESLRFFKEIGASIELDDLIMELRLANDETLGAPDSGTAHPEWLYGWLAPMVF
jgi:GNAT superfamily N-acetyltransferase